MPVDIPARKAWGDEQWSYLFRYLNGQSTTRQLEILEDLRSVGAVVSAFQEDHKKEWQESGIGGGGFRLQMCSFAVMHKFFRDMTWEKFLGGYQIRIRQISPDPKFIRDWQMDVERFWREGPQPGLVGSGPVALVELLPPEGKYWEITDFSVDSLSYVNTFGGSVIWGKITFESRFEETPLKLERSIGLVGGSVGKSTGSIPKAIVPDAFINKFPNLAKYMFAEGSVEWFFSKPIDRAKMSLIEALTRQRAIQQLIVKQNRGKALSYGDAKFPAKTVGTVIGVKDRTLYPADLYGKCIVSALQGTLLIGGATGVAMTLGMESYFNLRDIKGIAGFLTAGPSLQTLQFGVTGTIYLGEIV